MGDARNRYANLKADYLHQRIEECKGIVLLTANIRENIDSAFTPLWDTTFELPLPEPEERQEMSEPYFSAGQEGGRLRG